MLALFDPEKKTAKNLIIKTLSEAWPFSAKKLYNTLKRQYRLGLTYQAVHFALHELLRQGVLECKNRRYMLSPYWVEMVNAFTNELVERYEKKHCLKKPRKFQVVNFRSIAEVWDFILSNAESDFFGESKLFYAYLRRLFPVPVSSDQIERIKRFCSTHEVVILCQSDSVVDKLVARFLRKLGAKVYLGMGCEHPANIMVFKDSVMTLYVLYPQKDLARFGNVSESRKALSKILRQDILNSMASFAKKNLRFKAIIDRDPDVKANVLWAIQRLISRKKSK